MQNHKENLLIYFYFKMCALPPKVAFMPLFNYFSGRIVELQKEKDDSFVHIAKEEWSPLE